MTVGAESTDTSSIELPSWNLSDIYSSFEDERFVSDCARLVRIQALLQEELNSGVPEDRNAFLNWLSSTLDQLDEYNTLSSTLHAWAEALYTAGQDSEKALVWLNKLEKMMVPMASISVVFYRTLKAHEGLVCELSKEPCLSDRSFLLKKMTQEAEHLLDPHLEDLAAELASSGGDAWSRLHTAVSSNLKVLWDEKTGERKSVTALRSLAHDSDRNIRKKAFNAELDAWQSVEIPMAAALNGVKGWADSLETKRQWTTPLHKAVFQSNMRMQELDALLGSMNTALPLFHRYLKAKASLLGLEKLAFYDIFAPVGSAGKKWTFTESQQLIVEQFERFDPEMAAFASSAFERRWIDAPLRHGKVGGAYCTHFPLRKQPRVLCNYDGSYSSVATLAHELGHAWHYDLVKDLPYSLADYPMPLAETASIFAETLVFEGVLAASSVEEQLNLVEMNLQDSCQVIVDILSRFRFEKEVFEQRTHGELSASEFSAIMKRVQLECYGPALDSEAAHPWMWAVKGHYYSPELGFYNFPYAFGLLFSLGMYDKWEQAGTEFVPIYREVLRRSGQWAASDVAALADFTLSGSQASWNNALALLTARVELFERLVAGKDEL